MACLFLRTIRADRSTLIYLFFTCLMQVQPLLIDEEPIPDAKKWLCDSAQGYDGTTAVPSPGADLQT